MNLFMSSQMFSWLSFLHLFFTIKLLVLLQSSHVSSSAGEFYRTCGNTFSCGNTITEIGYPFRRYTDPAYCGHPSLVLNCNDRNNATTIDIMNTTYRVLQIYQATETMRIVREDMMEDPCPQEMVNTTLDYSLFDYAASYTNLTFLYGCPASNFPGLSLTPCGNSGYSGVYVFPGSQGPGSCNASVVVPVVLDGSGGGGSMNTTSLNQVIQQGFEVRWKIGGKSCSDCVDSKGRCGYDVGTNQTTCFCPDPPYVSDTCPMASGASPGNAPSPGTHGVNAFYFRIECLIMIASLSDSSDCFSRLVILSTDNKIVQCFSLLTYQGLSCLYMDQDIGMNSSPLYWDHFRSRLYYLLDCLAY